MKFTGSNLRRNYILLLSLLLLLSNDNIAQYTDLKTLPLVQGADTTPTSPVNNIEDANLERIKKIYQKLVNARGDFRYKIPEVFLRNEVSRVASIDYDRLEIVIEEKAFKTCEKYGDAAIAFLLGHELTHYYEKHAWRNGFVSGFSDLKVGKDLKKLTDNVANETQADYLGGFLAYSAGYGMFEKSGEILRSLYADYNMGENLPGYPSLSDRVELAKRTTSKLESLIEVFEMANLLAATGKYPEAYQYYNYMLMQYQSREIYNNLGVTSAMDAIQYFDKEKELIFQYPLELDLELQGSRDNSTIDTRNNLLKTAIRHFDAAINLDPDYSPAYLNKATALALMGDTIKAKFYAEQEAVPVALKKKDFKTASDVNVLLGILKAKSGDKTAAQKFFDEAVKLYTENGLAKSNLDILKNGITQTVTVQRTPNSELDVMSGKNLRSFDTKRQKDNNKIISLNDNLTFFQVDSADYKIYYTKDETTNIRTYFLITKPENKSKTLKNIGIGDTAENVVNVYGKANKIIETPLSKIMVFNSVLFILDENQKVKQWVSYYSKKSFF